MRATVLGLVIAGWAPLLASAQTAPTATVSGEVLDQYDTGIPGATVSAAESGGQTYSTESGPSGAFTLADLPAAPYSPGTSYTLTVTPPQGYRPSTPQTLSLFGGENFSPDYLIVKAEDGALTGVVKDQNGQPLYGMPVQVSSYQYATTGPTGRYEISGLVPGRYTLTVMDGAVARTEGSATIAGDTITLNATLPPPDVPTGTVAGNSVRDLGYLNAERQADGLPAGIVLNTRWSVECAAHDHYLYENHLAPQHTESSSQPGYSQGGAWAAGNSVLSEGTAWKPDANPWENAPIHLDQLFAPSLSVLGIDESHGYAAVTTWAGMLRPAVSADAISTYPGNHQTGVPSSEVANEAPFTPQQLVGIKAGAETGRQIFVYLNRAGVVGQAPVTVLSATMKTASGQSVALDFVSTTNPKTDGLLAGAVLIPVKPLATGRTYTVSVTVKDGSGSLSHSWSFATAP